MRFGGSDVDQYTCQLDEQPPVENCVSPYPLAMLAPGEHTFMVTPVVSAGAPPLPGTMLARLVGQNERGWYTAHARSADFSRIAG